MLEGCGSVVPENRLSVGVQGIEQYSEGQTRLASEYVMCPGNLVIESLYR